MLLFISHAQRNGRIVRMVDSPNLSESELTLSLVNLQLEPGDYIHYQACDARI